MILAESPQKIPLRRLHARLKIFFAAAEKAGHGLFLTVDAPDDSSFGTLVKSDPCAPNARKIRHPPQSKAQLRITDWGKGDKEDQSGGQDCPLHTHRIIV